MIDPADDTTAELPGLPPRPPKPPKPPKPPTAEDRKRAAGFVGPRDRANCRSCKHSQLFVQRPDSFSEAATLRCRLLDTPVQLGAWCQRWEK